ncbi:pyridoxal 5'-phosphate synthase glutaminase subunit PdxT [Sinosporangium siamense]|uniref:Pyridoxal 5'-phosphate synthase subunit PdxT n=1 Tax=Sinosporangium siamense TaxID=1367973 RepID=A0A919RKM7_9ACTN|nr:pyridoxal 5'-phosphate synthase glutaminase subunit PdxT [Sinosporangium siamense]GII95348.1 pyridoxal 5'-phosphate synthase subunit PdxT [Sinosporangium siamense]
MTPAPTVGVLALQGDVREHLHSLTATGLRAVTVRRPAELDAVDALVIPGGESTTMWKLAEAFEMLEPVRMRIKEGMPAYGSCAGMIMLADRIEGGMDGQQTFGGIDMVVRRNAFGRQVDSFESDLEFSGLGQVRGVFIRAPWVESVGDAVEVLARADTGDRIVAVRQGPLLATSFHPELTGEARVHSYFAEMVREF